jgi:hypothetical protein
MDWNEIIAAGVATLVAGCIEEVIRHNIKGRVGTLAGGAVGAAAWPKVRGQVKRWLEGGLGSTQA